MALGLRLGVCLWTIELECGLRVRLIRLVGIGHGVGAVLSGASHDRIDKILRAIVPPGLLAKHSLSGGLLRLNVNSKYKMMYLNSQRFELFGC